MPPSSCVVRLLKLKAVSAGAIALLVPVVPLSIPSFSTSSVLAQTEPAAQSTEGDRLLQQGKEQFAAGDYNASAQTLQQALEVYEALQDLDGQGQSLKELGVVYFYLQDYAESIRYSQQALAIAETLQNQDLQWRSLNNLGLAYYWLEDYDTAIQHYQSALAIAEELADLEAQGMVLNNLGDVYYWDNQPEVAIEFHQQSLAIAEDTANLPQQFNAWKSLGLAYEAAGDYDGAIASYEMAVQIAKSLEEPLAEAQALLGIALVYEQLADYSNAAMFYESALSIARSLENLTLIDVIVSGLGRIYQELEQPERAATFLEESLSITRELGDPASEQALLTLLGNIYQESGDFVKAADYHQQSLSLAQQNDNLRAAGESLNNLGNSYAGLGQLSLALDYYQQALDLAEDIGYSPLERTALLSLGSIYHQELGRPDYALTLYQRSLDIPIEASSPSELLVSQKEQVSTYSRIGAAQQQLGEVESAIATYQEGLSLAETIDYGSGQAEILNLLGTLYHQALGDYQQAIAFYEESLALAQTLGYPAQMSTALGNLGSAYSALAEYDLAITYYQQQLALSEQLQDRLQQGRAFNNLGATLLNAGRLAEAEQALRQGIDLFQESRLGLPDTEKIAFLDQQNRTYRTLQKVLVAQNQPEAALVVAEQGRARAFADQLLYRYASESERPDLTTDLSLDEIKAVAKTQNATIVQYAVMYETVELAGQPPTAKESALFLWVIQPTGDIEFQQVDLTDRNLSELVSLVREAIGVRGNEPASITVTPDPEALERQQAQRQQQLQQLYQLLIDPITQYLPTDSNQRVVFIPQDELFLVPFAALVNADGDYLIEEHTILTAPSIQVLDLAYQRAIAPNLDNRPGHPLVVGNPTMPSIWNPQTNRTEQLSSLTGAEAEAIAIAETLGTEALLWDQAAETAVVERMPDAGVIHLATHGLLEYGTPEDSGVLDSPGAIALAPSGSGNGLLTSAEILELDLSAELVVLSACDTGRGQITGDGVVGLSRAFVAAGVPSVVVSLWAVDDAATAELMVAFYEQWEETGDKAQALRQAMLLTMENYPDPRLWAGFAFVGVSE